MRITNVLKAMQEAKPAKLFIGSATVAWIQPTAVCFVASDGGMSFVFPKNCKNAKVGKSMRLYSTNGTITAE